MDWNEITYDIPREIEPGAFGTKGHWGRLFQSGIVDGAIMGLPAPLHIFTADYGEECCGWVPNSPPASPPVRSNFYAGISDQPEAVRPDPELIAFALALAIFLVHGHNVLIHCGAGVSRSSYHTLAVLMALLDIGYEDALLLLRKSRPIAQPNTGFEAQLRRLEPEIREAGAWLRSH